MKDSSWPLLGSIDIHTVGFKPPMRRDNVRATQSPGTCRTALYCRSEQYWLALCWLSLCSIQWRRYRLRDPGATALTFRISRHPIMFAWRKCFDFKIICKSAYTCTPCILYIYGVYDT